MHLTAGTNNRLSKKHTGGSPPVSDDNQVERAPYGMQFSLKSEIQLNNLREYTRQCRSVLNEIRTDLYKAKADHGDSSLLSETAARLCRFCIEANSRGFGCLYEVALELQKTLLHSGSCRNRVGFWEAVHRSLFILAALVEQCEIDFRKSLAVQDAIEGLRRVSRNPNIRTDQAAWRSGGL